MKVFKQVLNKKGIPEREEIPISPNTFNELILVDGSGREFHVSVHKSSGIEVRCPEGVLRILPDTSNVIRIINTQFSGE